MHRSPRCREAILWWRVVKCEARSRIVLGIMWNLIIKSSFTVVKYPKLYLLIILTRSHFDLHLIAAQGGMNAPYVGQLMSIVMFDNSHAFNGHCPITPFLDGPWASSNGSELATSSVTRVPTSTRVRFLVE